MKFAVRDALEDDQGVVDKRLLVIESEFAQVLRNTRQASTQPNNNALTSSQTAPATVPVPSAGVAPASGPAPAGAAAKDEAKQLQTLKELFDKGLVTKEEYERKRREILDRL